MRKTSLLIFAGSFLFCSGARAGAASAAPPDAKTPAVSSAPAAAIPLPDVPAQAETASANLKEIQAQTTVDPMTRMIDSELPSLTREIQSRHQESSKILNSAPTIDLLRSLEKDWQRLAATLDSWNRDLTRRATDLDSQAARVTLLEQTWQDTLQLAQSAPDTPRPVLDHIQSMISSIDQTRQDIEKRRRRTLTLQTRVADVDTRVDQALASVKQAREEALSRLLERDSPPIWSSDVLSGARSSMAMDSRASIVTQFSGLSAYAARRPERFIIHGAVFIVLVAIVFWVRREVQPWANEEPGVSRAVHVLDAPWAAAFLLAMLASVWIYPQAPRLWRALIGAVALIPTVVLLRRILDPEFFSLLNALVVFYFVDRIRLIAAALAELSRFLLLAEIAAVIAFLAWLLRSTWRQVSSQADHGPLSKVGRFLEWSALGILAVAFLANILGYEGLANLAGDAVLRSAYLAVTLYALLRIIDIAVIVPLRVGPLSRLGMVKNHRALLWQRARWWLQRLALALWILATLELFAVRAPLFALLGDLWRAPLTVGSIHISLGDVAKLVITIWVAAWVSRLIRFVLEEDIYPRIRLPRGIPYAISTVLHYGILVAGFIIGLGALGIDMTKFTILAGAFGVGLGFGLQNILNNFFSGLILLFERPIKIGDVIEIGGATGTVQRIGIRASTIRTTSGSEVIVPNGNILSSQLTNWTFSSRQRAIEIPVSVVRGADPQHVTALLQKVVKENPQVAPNPSPKVIFDKFSAGSLDFIVRAWTARVDDWLQLRSDLTMAINAMLVQENLALK